MPFDTQHVMKPSPRSVMMLAKYSGGCNPKEQDQLHLVEDVFEIGNEEIKRNNKFMYEFCFI